MDLRLYALPHTIREPDMHCFTNKSSECCSDLECWYQHSGGNREGRGEDGEEECGEDVDCQGHEHALSVGIPPVPDVFILTHLVIINIIIN